MGQTMGVHVYDALSFKLLQTMQIERPVKAIRFAPDSHLLWTVAHPDSAAGLPETACAWRWQNAWLECQTALPASIGTHHIDTCRNGHHIAFQGTGGSEVYDYIGRHFVDLSALPSRRIVAISPQADRFAIATSDTVFLVAAHTNQIESRIPIPRKSPSQSCRIGTLSFSADGRWLGIGTRQSIIVWDIHHDCIRHTIDTQLTVSRLAFSPDASQLAAEDSLTPFGRSLIRLWALDSARPLQIFDSSARGLVELLAFSPDSRTLFSRQYGDNVWQWDIKSGQLIKSTHFGPNPKCKIISTLGDENLLIALDDTQREMGPLDGPLAMVETKPESAHSSAETDGPGHIVDPTLSIEVRIAAGTGIDHLLDTTRCDHIRVLDLKDGQERLVFQTPAIDLVAIALSSEQKQLATQCKSGRIDLFHVLTGQWLCKLMQSDDPRARSAAQTRVCFSPNGKYVAAGLFSDQLGLWHAATGEIAHIFQGHTRPCLLAFSPDGNLLASGSWDKTIRLWDVESGSCLLVIKAHSAEINSIVFTADGKFLAASDWAGTLRVFGL
ncbi:MAG TPA: WD40 repeat domain-containing protein [Polyangiaceae bacterium]|nr:MAG: WD domain, G-beta repeat [Deltaproteobacteria bacterium ADurb.Bin207]HNS99030.1 WD40 repeat domain-containing protein [Polyangiaceae bacterium]HNZ24994.1 WD40 repeat domain-containing protein [Polyangiaceae bacterium]HOE49704.1 WD40 repeat domain-containing protein [Polyangiaceae bacterium]HOH03061.1 WD40 repeat domain-containing protein [Polyangiaceae bacterium]